MKHIFTVHSPITFFAAYCIVKQLELPENDVIVIAAGYKPPMCIGSTVPAYQDSEKGVWKKIINIDLPKAHDKYIDTLIDGEEFHAYIDLMHAYQRLLVTHKQCKGFSFVEEGTASYVVPESLDFITRGANTSGFRSEGWKSIFRSLLRSIRGFNMRLLSLPYAPQVYTYVGDTKYYTFSADAYPGIDKERRIELDPDQNDQRLQQLASVSPLQNEVVWLEESFPQVYGVPKNVYQNAIDDTIQMLLVQKQIHRVFVKLRPRQQEKESLVITRLYVHGIQTIVLPSECIAEALLVISQDLFLIGIVSSLLWYGVLWKHRAFSMYDSLQHRSESVFDDLDVYWSKVNRVAMTSYEP